MNAISRFPVILSAALILAGCSGESGKTKPSNPKKPSATEKERANGSKPEEKKIEMAAATAISAEKITQDFLKDQEATKKKYEGKVLLVEGKVREAKQLGIGKTRTVALHGGGKEEVLAKIVECQFKEDSKSYNRCIGLTIGQTIKVKGKCTGFIDKGPRLQECEIVEVGADPAIAVTAVDLGKAYAKKGGDAEEKYGEKQLTVEGTVLETRSEGTFLYIVLTGGVEAKVVEREVAVKPEKGINVKLKGTCTGLASDKVKIWPAHLVP